ncbi:MAG: hypothetical protein LQ340_006093 [Diploschistes diacapsis]|nr:MAG: hypothetical protein LQ340_006093 [Diploschistes diacapsis]
MRPALASTLVACLAAFAAAAPLQETENMLLARTCPPGDGNHCCPEGQFSVCGSAPPPPEKCPAEVDDGLVHLEGRLLYDDTPVRSGGLDAVLE